MLAVVALCLLSLPAHGIDFNRERLWGNQKTPIPGANYCLCSSDANNATFTQAFATRYVWFDAGSMRGDGTGCNDPAEAQIGSDAEVAEIVCPTTGASAYVWGKVALIEAPASDQIDCTIHGYTTGSYQGTMDVACNCAARPDGTWGTAVSVDTGSISANTGWSVDAADVTCSGTCSAGALLWLRVNYTGGTNAGHTLGVRCSYAPA